MASRTKRPSFVRYWSEMGFGLRSRSSRGGFEPRIPAATMSAEIVHMACPSSDTSTIGEAPVRSRWNNAPQIPPAMVIAAGRSPIAEEPTIGQAELGGVSALANPPRATYMVLSNPGRSASGPRGPAPWPRTYTIPGFSARMCSTSTLRLIRAEGSQLVRKTSAPRTIR